MKRVTALLLALVIIVIGLSFAMLNPNPVALDFYFGALTLPLSLWLVIAFALGVLLGLSVMAVVVLRQRWALARLRRDVDSTREELSELRKLPIRNNF